MEGRSPSRWLVPLVSVAIFCGAVWVLDRELRQIGFLEVSRAIGRIPTSAVSLAIALTILNYVVLTWCDQLAFAYIGKRLARWRIAVASFTGYAISNTVGFGLVAGASVRYRFYSRWGLSAGELSRVVLFYSSTFWLGLLVLAGWALLFGPVALAGVRGAALARPLGVALLAASALYAFVPLVRHAPLRVRGFEIAFPAPRLVLGQYVASILDWTLAVAVLFVLLPEPRPPFLAVAAAFLVSQLLGLASSVPGGLGVFESSIVLLLKGNVSSSVLLSALVVYRVVYYLLPLVAALGILVADEVQQRRRDVARVASVFGALAHLGAPRLLAVLTFLAGALLLASGATPAAAGRLAWLGELVPLPVLETSHFVGSLVGVALLVLSHGLARRLDAAYYLTLIALATGVVASLLKGADYEEAGLLTALLLTFVPSRDHFDRKAAFFETTFSPSWVASMIAVLLASFWLGSFAFQHVEYGRELWWRFALDAEAPRFLRASVGATVGLLAFGLMRLLRATPPVLHVPTDEELASARQVIDSQEFTFPNLVFLRDKALLWNEARTGFVMYGVQGSTWVALGDPVGPPDVLPGLVRSFLERCDDFDGTPVFYEVRKDTLHHYADYGLTFVKVGEDARVSLDSFSLEGSHNSKFRQAVVRLAKAGGTFRVVPVHEVRTVLDELKAVSDDWLDSRSAAEKGFSLGSFEPEYLERFPIGIVERQGHIEAFASIWPSAAKLELSMDLMRYRSSAPNGVMDGLLVHLMLWGRTEGYHYMVLGMAPLAGLEHSHVAPLWAKAGGFIQRHGQSFYNFQGLRDYKNKFHPEWQARYLAYPGGLRLGRVVADVAALIAGGYRRLLFR
jgi:phosphatidylglycerol lysyltransferase